MSGPQSSPTQSSQAGPRHTLGGTASLEKYLSETASFVLCVFWSVKAHHNLLYCSPLLQKKTCVRQVVLDKQCPTRRAWIFIPPEYLFPLNIYSPWIFLAPEYLLIVVSPWIPSEGLAGAGPRHGPARSPSTTTTTTTTADNNNNNNNTNNNH